MVMDAGILPDSPQSQWWNNASSLTVPLRGLDRHSIPQTLGKPGRRVTLFHVHSVLVASFHNGGRIHVRQCHCDPLAKLSARELSSTSKQGLAGSILVHCPRSMKNKPMLFPFWQTRVHITGGSQNSMTYVSLTAITSCISFVVNSQAENLPGFVRLPPSLQQA